MGKFKPATFGLTVIIISVVSLGILASGVVDEALGLEIPPPELRVVGGCFRDCIDPTQAGFGTLDCPVGTEPQEGVCVAQTQDVDAMLIITNPDGTTTEEPVIVKPDGTIVKEDPVTGEQEPIIEPDPTMICASPKELVNGQCVDIAIELPSGQVHTILDVADPIACWLEVSAEILDSNGRVIGTEKAGFFKTLPVPQLSLTDIRTGIVIDQGAINIMPMMKCTVKESGGLSTTGDPFFFFPSFDIPLTLEPTTLVARVWSSVPDDITLLRITPTEDRPTTTASRLAGTLVDTFNFELDVPKLEFTSAEAMTIGTLNIPAERILVFLPDGMYDSSQHIVLDGQLVLHWNTGIASVDQVNYPIILETKLIRNPEGNVVSVENPLTIVREIAVEKNVGEDPIPNPMCQPDEVAKGQICIKVTGDGCEQGEVRVGSICVIQGEDPNVDPNIIQKFLVCINSGADCLLNAEFIPFYFIGMGLVVFIGALAQRKQPEIYGVPTGRF